MRHFPLPTLLVTFVITPLAAQDIEYLRALEKTQEARPATLTVAARIAPESEPGTPLVDLEPYDLLERVEEAERSLAAREAEYQRVAKGLRAEEIAQAKARRDQLQARLDQLVAGPREQEIDAARGRYRALLNLERRIEGAKNDCPHGSSEALGRT